MAGRIQGITIEIDGNTSKLTQALKGIDGQLNNTKKALKDIDGLLKLDPKNTELLTQKQKNLEKAIADTGTRLEELKKAQEGVEKGTDEWDRLQREIIATEQDLDKLKKQYNDFGSVAAQKVAAAGKQMEEFGGKVTKAGEALQPLSTAAAAGVAGLTGLAYKAVTTADDLSTLSKQSGFTTEEIQQMRYAADLVDVSFESIEGALKKLKPKITEDNKALAELGVTTKNADGTTRDATEVFYDTLEALSKVSNETERDQKAMEIFGKSADELAGIIDDGGAALKAYGQEAKDLGLIMDQDTVDSLNTVNDAIDKLKAQGGGALAKLGATVATALAPSLDKVVGLANRITDAISKLTPKQTETILKVLAITASISPLLKTGGKLISGVGKALQLAPKITSAAKVIGGALSLKTLGIVALVAGISALVVLVVKNWDKIKAWTLDMVEKVKTAFDNLKTSISNIWNGIKDAVTGAVDSVKTAVTKGFNAAKDKVSSVVSSISDNVKNTWDAVKTKTSDAFTAVGNTVSQKMANVKKSFEENGGGIKGAAAAAMTALKETYTLGYDAINAITGGKLDAMKKKASDIWNGIKETTSTIIGNMKTAISDKWEAIKTSVQGKIDGIKTAVSTKFNETVAKIKEIFTFDFKLPSLKLPTWSGIKDTLSGIVQNIKDKFTFDFKLPSLKLPSWDTIKGTLDAIVRSIKDKFTFDFKLPSLKLPSWDTMKSHFDGLVRSLKNAFDFSWSLPTFKLPKIKVSGGEAPWGLFGRGKLPSFSLSWYRKAYNNPILFTSPTILPTANGYKGFGDGTGAEIVMGLNKLRELVGSTNDITVNVYGAPGQSVNALADAVVQRITNLQMQRNAAYA